MLFRFTILIVLLLQNYAAVAAGEIYEDRMVILFVGLKEDDLTEAERKLTYGKKVIEIPRTDSWQGSIKNYKAQEVVLKQNTGFVGLYTPSGFLVRAVNLADNSTNTYTQSPPDLQRQGYKSEGMEIGYSTGGKPDPYKPIRHNDRNYAALAPGYGYNQEFNRPKQSKRSKIVDVLNFVPIDVVTPFNYPGNYDQVGIPAAYGLGVLPHIGGLIASWKRGQADKADYDYYKAQVPPDHAEYTPHTPVYSDNPTEARTPFSSDPNLYVPEEAPQAFKEAYPNYGQQFYEYQQ